MVGIDVYVHGTPYGEAFWGTRDNRDYLKTFYEGDTKEEWRSLVFQIAVIGGKTFYSYIRRNMLNVDGSNGAYFALTVSLDGAYCNDVFGLYNLFDAVFNQLCKGKIFTVQGGGKYKFLVRNFEDNTDAALLANIDSSFRDKIGLLESFNRIEKLSSDINQQHSYVDYSLGDIGSPAFYNDFKTNIIRVYPLLRSARMRLASLSADNEVFSQQNRRLSVLEGQIRQLEAEKKGLETEIARINAASGTTAKALESYMKKLRTYEQEIKRKDDEIQSLKRKLEQSGADSHIKELLTNINAPIQEIARRLAGRFPDGGSKEVEIPAVAGGKVDTEKGKGLLGKKTMRIVLLVCVAIGIVIMSLIGVNGKPSDTGSQNSAIDSNLDDSSDKQAQIQVWQDSVVKLNRLNDSISHIVTVKEGTIKEKDNTIRKLNGVKKNLIDSIGKLNQKIK